VTVSERADKKGSATGNSAATKWTDSTAAKWTAAATIIAALIGATALLLSKFIEPLGPMISQPAGTATPNAGDHGVPNPGVVIKEPLPGAIVTAEVSASGTARSVPAGQQVWLITKVGRGYYPQTPLALPSGGTGGWAETVFFGGNGDAGKTFALYAVLADEAAQGRFNNYLDEVNRGLSPPVLEEGVTYPNVSALAWATVVRK
jgi:hypothetical protein